MAANVRGTFASCYGEGIENSSNRPNPLTADSPHGRGEPLDAPMAADPHALFEEWFAEARLAEPELPEAMALATADATGAPSVRMVLLKGHDARGFVFYTNSRSRKGAELAANPRAALLFYWKSLRRQVRIEGRSSRSATPRPTPISPPARANPSSAPGPRTSRSRCRTAPTSRRATRRWPREYEGRDVPRPPHWWGYRVVPERIEFWTDRAHRLHERRLFTARRRRLDGKPALSMTAIGSKPTPR